MEREGRRDEKYLKFPRQNNIPSKFFSGSSSREQSRERSVGFTFCQNNFCQRQFRERIFRWDFRCCRFSFAPRNFGPVETFLLPEWNWMFNVAEIFQRPCDITSRYSLTLFAPSALSCPKGLLISPALLFHDLCLLIYAIVVGCVTIV